MPPPWTAQFRIDQPGGAGAGTPGIARVDLWRGQTINLTPTNAPPGATYEWKMVRPRNSTAVFLAPGGGAGENHATPHFTPDVWGTYLIQLSINNGSYTLELVAATKYDENGVLMKLGWRYPALNEKWLNASDPYGWKQAIEDIFDSLYGIIGNLSGYGTHNGDDGGETRAASPTVPAERRIRIHQIEQGFVDGLYLYTFRRVLDQRQIGQTVVQLVDHTRSTYEEGGGFPMWEPPSVKWGGGLTPQAGTGPGYSLVFLDTAAEIPVAVMSLDDLMFGRLGSVEPTSLCVFGSLLAVSMSLGVVVLEMSNILASKYVQDPNMAIISNPDGGGGFGAHSRMAMGMNQGGARIYITDKVNDKVYSTRVHLTAEITLGGPPT